MSMVVVAGPSPQGGLVNGTTICEPMSANQIVQPLAAVVGGLNGNHKRPRSSQQTVQGESADVCTSVDDQPVVGPNGVHLSEEDLPKCWNIGELAELEWAGRQGDGKMEAHRHPKIRYGQAGPLTGNRGAAQNFTPTIKVGKCC